MTAEPTKPDWRIGLSCKPQMRSHELYYEHGKIVDVAPSGTAGIVDKDGVLKITMDSGRTFWAPARDWMTA